MRLVLVPVGAQAQEWQQHPLSLPLGAQAQL